jgi:3-carboxy-cis,cis-muconate cycloisomerase
MPGLIASYLSAMIQEHERSVGGSQSEWPTIAAVIQSTGLAAASIAEIAEGLMVDPERMRKNLDATQGTIFAEKAAMLLAEKMGREKAHHLMQEATRRAVSQNRQLADVLREIPEAAKHLGASTIDNLATPEDYLGSAEYFRQRLLQKSDTVIKKG